MLFLAGAIVGVQGARLLQADVNINPSQTTQGQNPSQTTQGQNPSQTIDGRGTATPPQGGPAMTEQQVIFRVRTALVEAGSFVEDLGVRIVNGKAVLSGVVRSEEAKARAGARAATVVGERNVSNELRVR